MTPSFSIPKVKVRETALIGAVSARTGHSPAEAIEAIEVVLDGVGAMIPAGRRHMIASHLPPRAATALEQRDYAPERDAEWLLETVARREHTRSSTALEDIGAVLGALREALDPDTWRLCLSELPEGVARLIPPRPEPHEAPDPHRASRPSPPQRLASARPGSTHPLCESAPPTGTHQHSVARTRDPHRATKLSEATGLTQEREQTSLSEGHPPTERSLREV